MTMPIPTGSHVVRWVYSKDATVSAGQDAGWVDEVKFTPTPPLMLAAPRLLPDGSFAIGSGNANGNGLTPDDLAHLEVQASTNLVDWVTLPDALALVNGSLQINDPDRANYPQRFYRVINH